MTINIIQWNISYNCNIEKVSKFLLSNITENTVVCCQEVLEMHKNILIELLKPSDYSYSLDHRPPGIYDSKNRKLGVLTLVFNGKILLSEVIHRSLFPDRTLYTEILIEENLIKFLNFHSLTGVGYKKGKSSQFASIAEFLTFNNLDFFTCDANEPKVDSVEIEKIEFWDNGDKGKMPSLIFGKNRVHNLSDGVRQLSKFSKNFPISYKARKSSRRYDYIFNNISWKIEDLKYLYEESLIHSSDHSLVKGTYIKI